MSVQSSHAGAWPDTQQELLIEAAILSGRRAEASWRAWNAGASIDDVEWASFHLLPQVYANLHSQEWETADMERLKGTYRYTWYKNHRLVQELSRLIAGLRDGGVEVMAVRDVSLATHYYADVGRRPISDVQLVVHPDQAVRALQALGQLGHSFSEGSKEHLTRIRSSISIGAIGDLPTTLSWRPSHRNRFPFHVDTWSASTPVEVGGVEVRVPGPADQLHDICAHGVRWDVVPPTVWIVDAMTVLTQPVDWDRLVACTRDSHTTLATRSSLAYVRERFEAPVPEAAIRQLDEIPVSRGERAEWEARTGPSAVRGRARQYWYQYADVDDGSLWTRVTSFPMYLQRSWELEHLWQILPYAGRWGTAQMTSALRGRRRA